MSWLSKNVSAAINPVSERVGKILGYGSKPGPQNPYPRPDLAYLGDTSKLDYLKDPSKYNYLKDATPYDFLKTPSTANTYGANLPSSVKTFSDTYKAPGYSKSDSLYSDLLSSTQGPSSVDQVREQLNNEQLSQLLSGVDTDTKNSIGSLKSDFADRGLGGPGQISDIEGNALAQAYGTGDKTKAAARTALEQSSLDLQKNRENQAIAARTAAASAGQAEDTQANSIAATGAQGDVNNYLQALIAQLGGQVTAGEGAANRTNTNNLSYADLLKSGNQAYAGAQQSNDALFAQLLNARDLGAAGINSSNYNTGTQQQYQYAQPGYLDSLLRNIQLSVPIGG